MNDRLGHIRRARIIKKSLGTLVAAKYLKNRGWSVEASVHLLGRNV